MRVQLRLEVDCPTDAAWDALRSPASFAEIYAPIIEMVPVEPAIFPEHWPEGEARVALSTLMGIIAIGEQKIVISYAERDGVHIIEDSGRPLTGPLSVISRWRHRMAVSALPDGRTLYRDRLDISAGIATPFIWAAMWIMWQWRAARLRRLFARL